MQDYKIIINLEEVECGMIQNRGRKKICVFNLMI